MDAGNLVSGTESFDDELFNFVKEKRSRRQFYDTPSRKGVIASISEKSDKCAVVFFFTIIFRTRLGFCAKV